MAVRSSLAAGVILLGTVSASAASARDLTVSTLGGIYQEALRQVFFRPFSSATGIPIAEDVWSGGVQALRSKQPPGDAAGDLVQIAAEDLPAACDEGLLEKFDWAAIGGKDRFLPQGVSDCGVGALAYNFVLAWDRDKFPATPTWTDFWDVAKYPGKRGLRRGAKTNLEFALIADGVAPGDVYKVLRTDDGVNRAFLKLDQLKPYIVWWQLAPQAVQQLSSGEVLMASSVNAQITEVNRSEHRNFGIQWSGSLSEVDFWAIIKDTPNKGQALRFLDYASNPQIQGRLLALVGYGGLAKGANDGLAPELLAISPTNPAHLAVALPVDGQFWRENLDKLSQRFNAWMAR